MNFSKRLHKSISSAHFINDIGIASLRGNEQAQCKLTSSKFTFPLHMLGRHSAEKKVLQLQLCRFSHFSAQSACFTNHSINNLSLENKLTRSWSLWRPLANSNLLQLKTQRFMSSEKKDRDTQKASIIEFEEKSSGKELTMGHKVAQAGKDASYLVILLVGFGITGCLVWYVASELLFSFSANSVYSKAVKLISNNKMVEDFCGTPLKYYGEETSRGRRRHVSYQEYIVDGENYMRVKFYVAGSNRKGVVHADAKETSRGGFKFRFLFVEMQDFPHETVVIEDNRRELGQSS